MVNLWKILNKNEETDTEEVLLEFKLKNPYDFADLERKLKHIKGVRFVSTTARKKQTPNLPDVIGYARWNKSERDNKVNLLRGMSEISSVKYRLVA